MRGGAGHGTSSCSMRPQTPAVYLCLHTRPVDQHTGICCQARESKANVVVNLDDLAHCAGILQLSCRLLLHACSMKAAVSSQIRQLESPVQRGAKHPPRTIASLPRTPTASVPFLTASSAYSTWNLSRQPLQQGSCSAQSAHWPSNRCQEAALLTSVHRGRRR